MKDKKEKIVVLAIVSLFIATAVGCGNALEDFENDNAVTINDSFTRETLTKDKKAESIRDENCYIVTDQKTGVQYIVFREKVGYAGMGGITPRLNADGSLCVVDVDGSATEDEITKEVTEDEKTETYK